MASETESQAAGSSRSEQTRTDGVSPSDGPPDREELEAALRETRREISEHVAGIRRELSLPRLRLRERVRAHPMVAVLGALAAGGMLGRLLLSDGRPSREKGEVGTVLAEALGEARALAGEDRLDEDAIVEIERRYETALRAAVSSGSSSGSSSGLIGSLLSTLGKRLAREGVERLLPRLLEELRSAERFHE